MSIFHYLSLKMGVVSSGEAATLSMNPHLFSNIDMMFWSRLAKVTWDSFSALTVIKFNY